MSQKKTKPVGGVDHYKVGRNGRTLLAIDKKGNELVVTKNTDKIVRNARANTQRRADALNKQIQEEREAGIRRDG